MGTARIYGKKPTLCAKACDGIQIALHHPDAFVKEGAVQVAGDQKVGKKHCFHLCVGRICPFSMASITSAISPLPQGQST